ncbi:MAG: hypothetical protein H0X62_08885 [Bacteroidetes bacterium]|nr:hypothetical protein [Bacteroidota bacterium]
MAVLAGTAIGLMYKYFFSKEESEDFLTDAEEGATELVHKGKRAAHDVSDRFDEAVEKGKARMKRY